MSREVKLDSVVRSERLEFRLFAEEKRLLERASELVGADTPGAWVRTLAVREARKVLRENGEKVTFRRVVRNTA